MISKRNSCIFLKNLLREKLKENINAVKFYEILNAKYGTYVGNGHWFEMDKHYMRVGFGWCSQNELELGLEAINKTISELLIK